MTIPRYLWLLDAGHAPSTPGKRSPLVRDTTLLEEWEYNREVVRRIRVMLDQRGIANHEVTPHQNVDMKPSQRAALANAIPGSCRLVSVHANAHRMGKEFTSAGGVVVLYNRGSKTGSRIAQVFQRHLVNATGFRDRGIKPRGNLSILKRTRMPAIVTETGFYTNEDECLYLMSDEGRQKIAAAHVTAIVVMEKS